MLWDWVAATNLKPSSLIRPNRTTWDELADKDAGKGYRAIYQLLANPEQSTALLKEHLRPTTNAEFTHMRLWIAELDHDRYAVRERSHKVLLQSGKQARSLLQAALKRPASFESEQRIQALLASPESLKPGREAMRRVRAVQCWNG